MLKEFLDCIAKLSPDVPGITYTVLTGNAIGEKMVFSAGQPVFCSSPGGFLESNAENLSGIDSTGIFTLNSERIYSEVIGREKKIVVLGCGHVAIPIVRLAKMIGFHVTAIDDRQTFTDAAKSAGADRIICKEFGEALKELEGDADTFFVIVTRGHRYDEACLREICKKPHAYIGAMGAKRRVAMVKEVLLEEGYDKDLIESIHAPIGLDICSETPEEIAVSILAEIIEVKNRTKNVVYPDDIIRTVMGTGHEPAYAGRSVLCSIVSKEGSGPRDVGTRMLVLDNGTTVNTIGGGLMEAQVTRKALELLQEGKEFCLMKADLSADRAALEGEVCGGVIEVFMELV